MSGRLIDKEMVLLGDSIPLRDQIIDECTDEIARLRARLAEATAAMRELVDARAWEDIRAFLARAGEK